MVSYIYTNLPVDTTVSLPIHEGEIERVRKHFLHPMLTSNISAMSKSVLTILAPYRL